MNKSLAADLILYLHFLYVLGVVIPIPLIILGKFFSWNWIRNLFFRKIHFSMIFIVVLESIFGIACPLSVWEEAVRKGTNQDIYTQGFIASWISRLLFFDLPPWVFTIQYLIVAFIIIELFIWISPGKSVP